jgi:hypothetical protein
MSTDANALEEKIDALADEYRAQCLWFLPSDFYPRSVDQRLRVLRYIERYGDRTAYRKAAEARRWLLQTSSDGSVAS